MAVGSIASKMLGFADEVMEGFAKGIGDSGTIKASVNRMSSNMTKGQKKALRNINLKKAVDKARDVEINTLSTHGKKFKAYNGNNLNEVVKNKMRPNANFRKNMSGLGMVNRVAGIQDPTIGNRIGDAVGGGIKDTFNGIKSGQSVSQALAGAYMNGDKLRMDRVAGTFVGASAAARIATGGGLYKDRNGSTNIIGLPFI